MEELSNEEAAKEAEIRRDHAGDDVLRDDGEDDEGHYVDRNINNKGRVVWQSCDGGYNENCDCGDWELFLSTPAYPETANTVAAGYGETSLIGSGVFNSLALLRIPVGGHLLEVSAQKGVGISFDFGNSKERYACGCGSFFIASIRSHRNGSNRSQPLVFG